MSFKYVSTEKGKVVAEDSVDWSSSATLLFVSHIFHLLRLMQEKRSRSTGKNLKALGKWKNTSFQNMTLFTMTCRSGQKQTQNIMTISELKNDVNQELWRINNRYVIENYPCVSKSFKTWTSFHIYIHTINFPWKNLKNKMLFAQSLQKGHE
jgi:hypothetical protein